MSEYQICTVTHPLHSAGENATRTLLNILDAIGTTCLITADLPSDSTIREDHEVIEISSEGAGNNVFVAAFRFLRNQILMCVTIRRRPENIILFFGATSYILPILFSRLIGKTVIVEPRGDVPLTLRLNWEQQLPSPLAGGLAALVGLLERGGFAAANGVITYTANMARQLDLDPDSSAVYPHGARYVDINTFRPIVPFDERKAVVGFVGRIDEEKGIRELAMVAKQLPDDITFRFVGDGPLFDWLATELAAEIKAGTVELAGWVDHEEIPVELNRLQLLVMPSQPTEGLPTTILEALACGTPVYATPVAGVPDVVKEGETGFLMTDLQSSNIATEIVSILESAEIGTVSSAGRTLIEEEFCYNAAVQRYRRLFFECTVE